MRPVAEVQRKNEIVEKNPAIVVEINVDTTKGLETTTIQVDTKKQGEQVITPYGTFCLESVMFRGLKDEHRYANISYKNERVALYAVPQTHQFKLKKNGIGTLELSKNKPWLPRPPLIYVDSRVVVVDTNYDSSQPYKQKSK